MGVFAEDNFKHLYKTEERNKTMQNEYMNLGKTDEMFDSVFTRSITVGVLIACPHDDRDPLIDWMADCRREKANRHRNKHAVLL